MTTLYKKSELWFALLWIAVYVIGGSVCDSLSTHIGIQKVVTFPFFILLTALLYCWMHKNSLDKKYGICPVTVPARKFLYYLPLALAVTCNLWFGVKLNQGIGETLLYIGSMLFVGVLEEFIFRGLLFKAMEANDLRSAVIVSSLTFGIGHIVNLINGSGADLVSNLCQVFSACAFGFLFVTIFYRGGSLLPCILTHSLLNALDAFSVTPSPLWRIFTALFLTLLAVGYTLYLHKSLSVKE